MGKPVGAVVGAQAGVQVVISKGVAGPVTTAPVANPGPNTPPPPQARPVGAFQQFAKDVFAADASKNPFDAPKGPGLREIAANTATTTVNAPKDFVNQVKDVFVPDAKTGSANTEER